MSRLPPHPERGHNRFRILWIGHRADGKAFCEECGRRLARHHDRDYVWRVKRKWRNRPVRRLFNRLLLWWSTRKESR